MRTGDALFFSSNTLTGVGLKTFTSSPWNHAGIAVRVDHNNAITTGIEGKLYVLEINTQPRYDHVRERWVVGAGYSDFDDIKSNYNFIGGRPLKHEYRTARFVSRMIRFVALYDGYEFPDDIEPFISIWLGALLAESRDNKVFCSEYMALLYMYCLESGYLPELLGTEGPAIAITDDGMSTMAGTEPAVPAIPRMCMPKHYSYSFTPHSTIFEPHDVVVYRESCDWEPILGPVLLVTTIIIIVIYIGLPKRSA